MPRPTEPFKVHEKIDYKNASNWYAFGKINNPKKYIPNSFADQIKVSERGAVFYVHPTTYWGKYWNPEKQFVVQAIVKKLLLVNHASAFSACCEVYAPHYRQANMYAFLNIPTNAETQLRSINLAYRDVKDAFEVFLEENQGKGFFLAGHSQGTHLLRRLIYEHENNKKFREGLIAAYLPGFNITSNQFKIIKACKKFNDNGCYNSWNSTIDRRRPYFEDKNLSCINPISWSKNNTPAFFENSEGAMPFSSYQVSDLTKGKNRKILNLSGSTMCKAGNLIIRGSKLDSFPDKAFNLHFYDYALFYGDILKNSINRLEAYNRK